MDTFDTFRLCGPAPARPSDIVTFNTACPVDPGGEPRGGVKSPAGKLSEINTQPEPSQLTTSVDQPIGPAQFRPIVRQKWPLSTEVITIANPAHAAIYAEVRDSGVPNYMCARRPIPSGLNIAA